MEKVLIEELKALARRRMEKTLHRISSKDQGYNEVMEEVILLEKQYETLNLEPDTRGIIDKLMEGRDAVELETVSLAYLAGIEDGILILKELELIEM